MKIKMCRCKWSGLIRPEGPIKIKKTRVLSPDVLVARLGGAVRAEVAVVQVKKKFYLKAPEKLGGVKEIPADHLTDGVNFAVWEMNEALKKSKKK